VTGGAPGAPATGEARAPLLSVRGVGKMFGPTRVLGGVSFDVFPGEVVALLGENGAGKSTLSGIIAGSLPPTEGTMAWLGAPYAPSGPKEAIDKGISLIHQELKLLPHLSVAENVFIGHWPTKGGAIDRAGMNRRAAELLGRLGLEVSPTRRVEGLSTAAQQIIEIAKALALNARLLILDEPTAAIGGAETELLFRQIARLKADGVGIIYISHRLAEIGEIADRILVLRDGALVATHAEGKVPVRRIIEDMVGRTIERMFPPLPSADEETVLAVEGLCGDDFADVSFSVRRGEIFGIAGLVGAGRTELVRAMTGADPLRAGRVTVRGRDVTPRTPAAAIREGMLLVPEDRKHQGLVLEHTLADNLIYSNLDIVAPKGWVRGAFAAGFVAENLRRLGVKGEARQRADQLSGGNQQKVVLAKWLARAPHIVVLDEPTRGIDVGARSSIYDIIVELSRRGVAVVVVSSDLEEVLGISHRIMVLSHGRQTGILPREAASEVAVMELATR
jgi:ribose transport system ATP-binding protein